MGVNTRMHHQLAYTGYKYCVVHHSIPWIVVFAYLPYRRNCTSLS